MRILFVAPRFHTNQIPLVRMLQAKGHEVVYDVLRVGKSEEHSLLTPKLIEASRPGRRTPHQVATYVRRLRCLRPDVIVVKGLPQPFARPVAAVAILAARVAGIPIVLYTQGPVHGRRSPMKRLARGALLRGLRAEWYSPVAGDTMLPKTHEGVRYLPFAAEPREEQKSTWFRDGSVHILTIGKFVERKNHLLLIEAFRTLRASVDAKLTIVGEVSRTVHERHHADVLRAITSHGLDGDVTVMTNVPFANVQRMYLEHDLFVLPSRSEPAAVSILEAMAFGLPVICSSANGTQCYIEHGRNGYVFVSDDLQDLTAKLVAAVGDRERLMRMGARSSALAGTVHHPDTIYHGFMELVERQVAKVHPKAAP